MEKTKQIQNALSAYGISLFQDDSSYAWPRATHALEGRTHYLDDLTVKYFGCRVNRSAVDFNGLYCWIIESIKHPSDGRMHRFVLFDVFGAVLTERSGGLRKTARQAEKDKELFLGSFDPVAHTEMALRGKIDRNLQCIDKALEILNTIVN